MRGHPPGIRVYKGDVIRMRVLASVAYTIQALGTIEYDREREPTDFRLGPKTSNADRATLVTDDYIVESHGTLTGLCFDQTGTVARRGQMHVTAVIYGAASKRPRQVIAEDYADGDPGPTMGVIKEWGDGKGLIVTNRGTVTLVNNTTASRNITVPTNTRVELSGGVIENGDDVARVIRVYCDNGTGPQNMAILAGVSIAAGDFKGYPRGEDAPGADYESSEHGTGPVPLYDGSRVVIVWTAGGASAGGASESSANWQEWLEP